MALRQEICYTGAECGALWEQGTNNHLPAPAIPSWQHGHQWDPAEDGVAVQQPPWATAYF